MKILTGRAGGRPVPVVRTAQSAGRARTQDGASSLPTNTHRPTIPSLEPLGYHLPVPFDVTISHFPGIQRWERGGECLHN